MSHLRFEHLLQTVGPEEFRPKTVKVEAIAFGVKRRKKRKSLNMIPMVVRDKNMRFGGLGSVRTHPAVSQHAKAGSAVQDKLRAVGRQQFQARRVSAIAPRRRVYRRRRAAHTPEAESCSWRGHLLALEGVSECASMIFLGRKSPLKQDPLHGRQRLR